MEENKITLKKDSILRFAIETADGKPTGEYLTFDLEDIELPLRLSQCEDAHNKNVEYLRDKMVILEKQEDKKGRFLDSWKDEEKIRIFRDFYKKEMEALDLFLGEGGTAKLLNGRNPYYTMYDDINDMLEPILPKIQIRVDDIKKKIISKYDINEKEVMK